MYIRTKNAFLHIYARERLFRFAVYRKGESDA